MSTTRQLMDALRAHYRKPGTDQDGEVLIPEAAAPGSNRRCDLLRIGIWPSRGLGIDVHELKTSRTDWLRELDQPAKADAWWEYSSRFWVVAPPGMIQPEELPPGWGLMVPPTRAGQRRFKIVVKPQNRTPKLTMQLLTELVSRTDNVRAREIWLLKQDHLNELTAQERRVRAEAGVVRLDHDTRETLDLLAKLEKAMGMTLTDWTWPGNTSQVTVEELAAVFGDFAQRHIALQRRAEDLGKAEAKLRRTAEGILSGLAGQDA